MSEKLPPRTLIDATRQLALLARLGYPLGEGLRSMGEASPWLQRLARQTDEGDTLSEAVHRHPRVFSPFYASMLEAAEVAEKPDGLLTALSTWLERADQTRGRIRTALLYPMLCLNMLFLELVVMCVLVVPGVLVPLGQMLMQAHGGLPEWIPSLTRSQGVTALVVLAWGTIDLAASRDVGFAAGVSTWLPWIGPLRSLGEQSLWARALGSLLAAGVDLPRALDQAASVVRVPALHEPFARLSLDVRRGAALGSALEKCAAIDSYITWSVASAEEQGNLATALLDASDLLDEEIAVRAEACGRMAEPWAITAIGVLVLLGILFFWWPFYQMAGMSAGVP